MRNLLVLVKNNLNLMIWKSKSKFLIFIVLPVLIIFVMSKFMGSGQGPIKVGVINMDNTPVANYIISTLKDNNEITLVNTTKANLDSEFAKNSIGSAIVINKGFENNLLDGSNDGIKIIGRDGNDSYKLVEEIINSNIMNIDKLASASNENIVSFNAMLKTYENNKINISEITKNNLNSENTIGSLFVGFLVMFILGRAMSGAERILEDKKNGIFERLLLTDTNIFSYYLANILASLVAITIQIVASLLVVTKVCGLNLGISIFDMSIILILTALFAVSFGTFFVSISRNSEEAGMLSSIIIMAFVMLGGCFIPVSIFPSFMNEISSILPTRWIMNMVSNIQGGNTLISQSENMILLISISIEILLITAFITKNKDRKR